ncbi:MAG: HNH endonuclease [Candidatus Eutrophobiaceae bacterium]
MAKNNKEFSVDSLSGRATEHYRVAESFGLGRKFSLHEFKKRYFAKYRSRKPGSILPSDFAWNNNQLARDDFPSFLEKCNIATATYQFIGLKEGQKRKQQKATTFISEEKLQNDIAKQVKRSLRDGSEKRRKRLKTANTKPESIQIISKGYKRNPDVIAEVLERAKGFCEQCKSEAPFKRRKDNSPYLEVHHKITLAQGGEDTVQNALALCPNCHREAHFGKKS